ncbi:SCP-2 sterol transfer family protein [Pigmentiphaga humi]|uniref:Ubiquinone biosynthesis accessory factor UbiJ n=1 Tax=Pigmentiphaga humi TaxID=2478468 RepID=A0A3P4AX14_9BURK|nr:SCP2 sterol-binding domain-containing protein [Pigmentiphaga humi]VCU67998.1 SCP-2 sterol transfer family protein [Pigmentiphaga humi]
MPALLPTLSATAVRALDTLLVREPWARERLRPHAGKTACLVFGGTRLALAVTPHGLVEQAAPETVPDVVLTIDAGKLADLLSGDTARRMGAVRIEGDAALAHVVGDLARDLRWDVEDDLAGLFGDIAAARLAGAARGLAGAVRASAWRLAGNVAEYVTEERGAVAAAHAVQGWGAEVRRLRDDAERAAKRAEHLRARLEHLESRLPPVEGSVGREGDN